MNTRRSRRSYRFIPAAWWRFWTISRSAGWLSEEPTRTTGACTLYLTKDGGEVLKRIGKVAREHQDALLFVLNQEERDELANLLLKIADQQGLVRGVHPGYPRMGKAEAL